MTGKEAFESKIPGYINIDREHVDASRPRKRRNGWIDCFRGVDSAHRIQGEGLPLMDLALMLWMMTLGIPIMRGELLTSDTLTSNKDIECHILVSHIIMAVRLPS